MHRPSTYSHCPIASGATMMAGKVADALPTERCSPLPLVVRVASNLACHHHWCWTATSPLLLFFKIFNLILIKFRLKLFLDEHALDRPQPFDEVMPLFKAVISTLSLCLRKWWHFKALNKTRFTLGSYLRKEESFRPLFEIFTLTFFFLYSHV